MMKNKLCKLITIGLTVIMFMGSVGTTVSAAEAGTASTDIIMFEEVHEGAVNADDEPSSNAVQTPGDDGESSAGAVSTSGDNGETSAGAVPTSGDNGESSTGAVPTSGGNGETTASTAPAAQVTVGEQAETQTESVGQDGAAAQDIAEVQADAQTEATEEENVAEDPAESAADPAVVDDPQDPDMPEEKDLSFTITGLELSSADLKVDEKTAQQLTATLTVEAVNTENIAERVKGAFAWSSSDETVAVIREVSAAPVSGDGTEAEPVQCTVVLTVTVSALKEGSAVLFVSAGGHMAECSVCVDPVPVALAKCTDLVWKNVTVLYWDAVKNASSYRITTYLINNGKTYSKTISVKVTHYDLEDEIVALIKSNKASLKGTSYTIRAAVWANPTDKIHFKTSPGAKSNTIRYQAATYEEALCRNGWFYKGGKWYFYENGAKTTGWITFQKKRYYLDADGVLQTNCWIGNKYVKSNGEMATDEWVDSYQYYVDAKGIRQDNVTFKTTNWVKNSKGWRYKTATGYVKGQWKQISHQLYYFDKDGYMKTGWLKEGTQKYYFKPIGDITAGRGVMQTGWVKSGSYYYWFNDDGSLATNAWVDRGQYYVNSAGRRLGYMNYMDLRNVNTSNRLGYYIYNKGAAPEQSIAGFEKSYQQGNRIMVVNLRFTKDNIPVCFHDDQIKYARRKDGSEPGKKPVISSSTLKQLQEYDYGIKWGKQYKGTGPLTLEELVKWISKHADTEVYIEVKADKMSATQINKTAAILNKYKVTGQSSMIFDVKTASDTRAQRVHKKLPTMRIGITTGSIGSVAIEQAQKCKSAQNEVFLYCWKTTKLSVAAVKKLKLLDVQFECGTFSKENDLDEILSYYTKGSAYTYTTGIETAGDVFHKLLRAATCHEKAHWVTTAAGKKYMLIDGTYVRSKWFTLDGKTYRFDKNGIMLKGWFTLNGKRYYLNTRGERVTGKRTIDGHMYLFDENGVAVKRLT